MRGVLVHRSRRCLPPRPYTGEGQDDEGVAESSTVLTIILVMAAMVRGTASPSGGGGGHPHPEVGYLGVAFRACRVWCRACHRFRCG